MPSSGRRGFLDLGLFDGGFASELIELGRADAQAHEDVLHELVVR